MCTSQIPFLFCWFWCHLDLERSLKLMIWFDRHILLSLPNYLPENILLFGASKRARGNLLHAAKFIGVGHALPPFSFVGLWYKNLGPCNVLHVANTDCCVPLVVSTTFYISCSVGGIVSLSPSGKVWRTSLEFRKYQPTNIAQSQSSVPLFGENSNKSLPPSHGTYTPAPNPLQLIKICKSCVH